MADRIVIDLHATNATGPTISDLIGRSCVIIYNDGDIRCGTVTKVITGGFYTTVNGIDIFYRTKDLRRIETQ